MPQPQLIYIIIIITSLCTLIQLFLSHVSRISIKLLVCKSTEIKDTSLHKTVDHTPIASSDINSITVNTINCKANQNLAMLCKIHYPLRRHPYLLLCHIYIKDYIYWVHFVKKCVFEFLIFNYAVQQSTHSSLNNFHTFLETRFLIWPV